MIFENTERTVWKREEESQRSSGRGNRGNFDCIQRRRSLSLRGRIERERVGSVKFLMDDDSFKRTGGVAARTSASA